MNPANRHSTSLMDIILGAIGAFFFLLIILSASQRGITREGTDVPSNMMILTVKRPTELKVGESIHYFVAQLKDKHSGEIEKIFYSDIKNEDDKNSLVNVNANLAYPMIMATDDPAPPIIVGVWLQDVLALTRSEDFPKQPISINVKCKKICPSLPQGFDIELNKENHFFVAYLLNDGVSFKHTLNLRYNHQPVIRDNVPCRAADEQWKPIRSSEVRENVSERDFFIYIDQAYSNKDSTKWNFFVEAGFVKLNNTKVFFRFVGGFNSPIKHPHEDPREAIINFFKHQSEFNVDLITYLAAGDRAVCAVLGDGSLRFQGTNGKDLSYYPFSQYLSGTIGTISKQTADKMIVKMKQVEPGLSADPDVPYRQVLAEMISGPNNCQTPYPAVRQHPLLWNFEK